MAKGKYAARAVNRAAAIDNDVIVELRAKLAAAEADRDRLAGELDAQVRRVTGEVNRRVDAAMRDERAAMAAAHDQEVAALAAFKAEVADEVVDMVDSIKDGYAYQIGEMGGEYRVPAALINPMDSGGPSLLRVLDMLDVDHAGQIMEQLSTADGASDWSREERRRSARRMSRALNKNIRREMNYDFQVASLASHLLRRQRAESAGKAQAGQVTAP